MTTSVDSDLGLECLPRTVHLKIQDGYGTGTNTCTLTDKVLHYDEKLIKICVLHFF